MASLPHPFDSSAPAALREGGLSVVVVGHDDLFREALVLLLERSGTYTVGAAACTCATAHADPDWSRPCDVAVMQLWHCDPARVLPTVRAISARARVVALTRVLDAALIDDLRAAGASAIVGDRSSADLLHLAIHEAAAGRSVIGPDDGDFLAGPGVTAGIGRPTPLTHVERETLRLIALGHTNAEVARTLHRSVRSIEACRSALLRRIGGTSRVDLVRAAQLLGLVGRSRW